MFLDELEEVARKTGCLDETTGGGTILAPPARIELDGTVDIGGRNSAGGRSHQAEDLARAAIALKISGLFIEVHPNPDKALCDGPSATKLEDFEDMIIKIKKIDDLVKSEKF